VFLSDTALHYYTSTIEFDQISTVSQSMQESGYGLSKMCLDLNRIKDNYGFPCSLDLAGIDPNVVEHDNELSRLQSNISKTSQIRLTGAQDMSSNVAMMIPLPATIAAGDDYRASTVGISTQCKLIPPAKCGLKDIGSLNTQFNCSDDFYGVLGLTPAINSLNGTKAADPNLSPLAFKTASNLQTAFFSDDSLTNIWNPEGWNASTDQPTVEDLTPDQGLINPLWLGVAARVAVSSLTAGSTLNSSEDVLHYSNFLDMIMSCSVTSFQVNYTWFKSSIRNVTVEPSPNGTLLEVFHGAQIYNSVSGGGWDLQMYLSEAAITGEDSASFLGAWADLYSVKVLSQIGAYLTPRTNLQEQRRNTVLVAKVPKPALGALVACSLLYTALGILLVVGAYRASSREVKLIAEQLSLAGLTDMAFGEKRSGFETRSATLTPGSRNEQTREDDSFNQSSRRDTRKVRISGTDFRLWV